MNHTIARRRLRAVHHAPMDNVVHFRDLGRKAREAEEARIAELLGPVDPEFLRHVTTDADGTCWMPAEFLAALAGAS